MSVFHWILAGGFGICLISCLVQFFRVVQSTRLTPYSKPLGKRGPGVVYALTSAMSPAKKETAYLHLPTYSAGILFHLGTFCSLLMLALLFFDVPFSLSWLIAIFLLLTSASGFFILVKRIVLKKMRSLSNPDDYISNLMVTLFQLISALVLFEVLSPVLLFVYSTLLLLYIPVGKLRHTIYFFTSRFHLGLFYGWRGVCPLKKDQVG